MQKGLQDQTGLDLELGEPDENPSRTTGCGDGWYTPIVWARRIRGALGGPVDLDPCGAISELDQIKARRSIVQREGGDGLAERWAERRVYVNPPYSDMKRWHAKILNEQIECGHVLVLAPLRPSSTWWRRLADSADFVGAPHRRIAFVDGRTGKAQSTGRCELTFFGWRLVCPSALGVIEMRPSNLGVQPLLQVPAPPEDARQAVLPCF